MATEGGEPKRKRSTPIDVQGGAEKPLGSSSAPATPPAGLMVADAEALDCGVCLLPLKPPIFQCAVGHVLCLPCSDKLKGAGKCHVCRRSTKSSGGYRRCHAMERVVEGIRSACPNAAYGCAATPPRYGREREEHLLTCPHAPCHCPGEACGFKASTAALLEHFRAAHGWPCVADAKADQYGEFAVCLRDGFNSVAADCSIPTVRCLLLLNVVRRPHDRAISVLCIDPHAGAGDGAPAAPSKGIKCRLSYLRSQSPCIGSNHLQPPLLVDHHQVSTFRVARTDLSNGMPKNPDSSCFQFVLADSVVASDHGKDGIKVTVSIVVN